MQPRVPRCPGELPTTAPRLRYGEESPMLQLQTLPGYRATSTAQPQDCHSRCPNPVRPFRCCAVTWPESSSRRHKCQQEKKAFQVAGAQSCEHSFSMVRTMASPASLPKKLEAGRAGPASSSSALCMMDRYLSNSSDCCSMRIPRPRASRYAAFLD